MSIDFIKDAVYTSYFELDKFNYSIIILILLISIIRDLPSGIGIGLILSFFLYIYKSSKSKYILTSNDYMTLSTNIIRTNKIIKKLYNSKRTAYVIQFGGYIFFGSCYNIIYEIDKLLSNIYTSKSDRMIKYIVLDFSRITGLDTSASITFVEWIGKKTNEGINICIVFNSKKYYEKMNKILNKRINGKKKEKVFIFNSYDEVMLFVENNLLNYNKIQMTRILPKNNDINSKTKYYIYKLKSIVSSYCNMDYKLIKDIYIKYLKEGVGKYEKYKAGEIICEGLKKTNGIFILLNGSVSCYSNDYINSSIYKSQTPHNNDNVIINFNENNRERLYILCHCGSVFGLFPTNNIILNYDTIIADENTSVYHITKNILLKYIHDKPDTINTMNILNNLFINRKQHYLTKKISLLTKPN